MRMRHDGLLKRHHLVPRAYSFLVTCSLKIKPSGSEDGNEVPRGKGRERKAGKNFILAAEKHLF